MMSNSKGRLCTALYYVKQEKTMGAVVLAAIAVLAVVAVARIIWVIRERSKK